MHEAALEFADRINAHDEYARKPEFHEWLREHKVDPDLCWEVIVLKDYVTVKQFVTNTDGAKFVDRISGDVVSVTYTIYKERELPDA